MGDHRSHVARLADARSVDGFDLLRRALAQDLFPRRREEKPPKPERVVTKELVRREMAL